MNTSPVPEALQQGRPLRLLPQGLREVPAARPMHLGRVLGRERLGQVRLGQVRLGRVRLGREPLGQVRPGQVPHNLAPGPVLELREAPDLGTGR